MSFFKKRLKGHSRNSSVSSASSCPLPEHVARSGPGSPDAAASFAAAIQQEEARWPQMSADEREHLASRRLTKTLSTLAADRCALGYLTAFLESRHAAGYLHFWMEAEAIRRQLETDQSALPNADSSRAKSRADCSDVVDGGSVVGPQCRAPSDCSDTVGGNSVSASNRPRCVNNDGLCDGRVNAACGDAIIRSRRDTDRAGSAERADPRTVLSSPRREPAMVAHCGTDDTSECSLLAGDSVSPSLRNGERVPPAAAALARLLDKYCGTEATPAPLRLGAAAAAPPAAEAAAALRTAQATAAAVIADQHLAEFLQSDHHQCYQVDVLTSSNVDICDILFNEAVLFIFMEFMEQEGLAHYVEFWMSSNNFRDQLYAMGADCDAAQTQNDAMILYDKYFSLQAASGLGFGDGTRTELELNICRDGGPQPECFLRPMLVLHNVLQQRYLSEFLNSQVFFKYAMDLVNTIRYPAKPYTVDRTDALSTCSSDLGSSVTGGSIPERWSHVDPGHLHRRRYYGLSIGHVNHVGRYESQLEPQPDPARPSALRRAVRSLLRHDHSKVQEEMAWRVANLIVKDVINVTLGPGGSPTHAAGHH